MRLFECGNKQRLYIEPHNQLVCIRPNYHTRSQEKIYFDLPVPGIIVKVDGAVSWWLIAAVDRDPTEGPIKTYHLPLPHIRSNGAVCLNERVTDIYDFYMKTVGGINKYWLYMPTYLKTHYASDLTGCYIADTKFFEEWETKYNIDNVLDSPYFEVAHLGWTDIISNFEEKDITQYYAEASR